MLDRQTNRIQETAITGQSGHNDPQMTPISCAYLMLSPVASLFRYSAKNSRVMGHHTSTHCTLAMCPARVRSSQLASYIFGPVEQRRHTRQAFYEPAYLWQLWQRMVSTPKGQLLTTALRSNTYTTVENHTACFCHIGMQQDSLHHLRQAGLPQPEYSGVATVQKINRGRRSRAVQQSLGKGRILAVH